MTIRVLPQGLVNRIAAGEVVERPAAAVKELVENAIDAGARDIEVTLADGGRSAIVVADDGCGMSREELLLAVERHATSKLPDDDLVHIVSLGFRGEALPAIGAAGRLAITSRVPGADTAWRLVVEAGVKGRPEPAALGRGTRVELRDLFFATPARLKFLKSARTEAEHALDAVRRLAMAHPEVAFGFTNDGRSLLRLAGSPPDLLGGPGVLLERLAAVMGREFADNALPIAAERDGVRLAGYIGLPTLNRATAASQYLFVNGRPVRDRLLQGAVRGAYQDFLARDRHAMVALFLELPLEEVDVNVHPTKAEVRFRDAGSVRALIVAAARHALAAAGHRASTEVGEAALDRFRVPQGPLGGVGPARAAVPAAASFALARSVAPAGLYEAAAAFQGPAAPEEPARDHPLGAARAQVHVTYIVAETVDGIVIVDQHAAHERLVYERMKQALAAGGVARQGLLLPEVVELDGPAAARLAERAAELAELGLVIEPFGAGAVVVREVPALLGLVDVQGLLRDLADELAEMGTALALKERLAEVCATMSCHGSVRAGRRLKQEEMDALLRQMESTPHSGQCSHGRPSYVELKLADIERLFGRR